MKPIEKQEKNETSNSEKKELNTTSVVLLGLEGSKKQRKF